MEEIEGHQPMCGIVGYFKGKDNRFSCDLQAAAETIRHRGPDMSRITSGQLYSVAFNRLSINDLTPSGMQPFSYDGVDAFMNGEIYNHKELREIHKEEFQSRSRSDAEILPFLYRRLGLRCFDQINGMFAVVLVDQRQGDCFLVLDRFGVKPLFYTFRNEVLFFASELKALGKILPLQVNPTAVSLAVSCYGFPYPYTPFVNVNRLEPGAVLRFKDGTTTVSRWYSPRIARSMSPNGEVRREFRSIFESAVELRLDCDVPVGGFISGGMDSTSILSIAHHRYNRDLHVFNAVIKDKALMGEGDGDNVNAAMLAKDLRLSYHPVTLDWDVYDRYLLRHVLSHDEILLDSGTLMFYMIAREARNYVTVMLDGVGGDELFGGYPWQALGQRLADKGFAGVNWPPFDVFSERMARLISRVSSRGTAMYKALTNLPLWHMQSLSVAPLWLLGDRSEMICDMLTELSRQRLAWCAGVLPDDLGNALQLLNYFSIIGFQNTEADRGCMAYSIEGRSPYLDYRLVELMMGVRSKAKGEGGQKALMRLWFRDCLPEYILGASKSGPSLPLTAWLIRNEGAARGIELLFRKNLDLIETLLGATCASAIMRRSTAIFRSGLILHTLLSLVIWGKKHVRGEKLDETQRLEEFLEMQQV